MGWGARDARPLSGPTILYFHSVFGKKWSNSRLPLPLGVLALVWEILDLPLGRVVTNGNGDMGRNG